MSISKRVIGGLVASGIAVFAGTNAMEDKTTRDDAGAIVESGGLGAFAVRHGDCVQLPDPGTQKVVSVEGGPCDSPHDAQVYAELTLTGDGAFPGVDAVQSSAGEQCASRWESTFGAYDPAKNLDLTFLAPSDDSWTSKDDRAVTCFVVAADGTPLLGSKVAG